MKMNRILTLATIAFAAFLTPASLRAADDPNKGDIVEIRAMDRPGMMTFGSRSVADLFRCSADHPLRAGDEVFFRVRMLVRNYVNVLPPTGQAPQEWTFKPGDLGIGSTRPELDLYSPKLGIVIGDRVDGAVYSEYGPQPWMKSGTLRTDDDLENEHPSSEWTYYTDLYFVYTVKPGDLGLPIRLANPSGTGPYDPSNPTADYYLENCSKDGKLAHWYLSDTLDNKANFHYYPESLPAKVSWPTGSTRVFQTDFAEEGVFMKTVDFDKTNWQGEDWSEGEVWREVYAGLGPDFLPTLTVEGGERKDATAVYIWSSDESKVLPAASGKNTIITVDGKKVLRVPIPAGDADSVSFSIKGADGAVEGDEADLFMSPTQGAVYKPTGELAGVTVTRRIRVGKPKPPTVRIYLDAQGTVTKTVEATPDYITCETKLMLYMQPICPEDVEVEIRGLVSTDDTMGTLEEIWNANVLRLTDADFGGDPSTKEFPAGGKFVVTIPAGTSVLPVNLYTLGATSKTQQKGVTFSLAKTGSTPSGVEVPDANCTLKIKRTYKPVIVSSEPAFKDGEEEGRIEIGSGTEVEFMLELEDTYMNLNDEGTGYTFTWKTEGEEIEDCADIFMDEDDGLFHGFATFNAITEGKELTLSVKAPNGLVSAVVKYWLVVTEGKYTTIRRYGDDRIVFCEGESTYVKLGLTQPYSGTGYIFLDADDPAQLKVVDSPLTKEGAMISRGSTEVAAERVIRFLDGSKDLSLKAVLYSVNEKTESKKVGSFGSGTIEYSVTNKPPKVASVTAAGQYVSPDMEGKTLADPISRGVKKMFSAVIDDVDADLYAQGAQAMQIKWVIDGETIVTNAIEESTSNAVQVAYTFNNEKDNALVQLFVKDKDMSGFPNAPTFFFYVRVKDTPRVEITTSSVSGTFLETDKSVSSIILTLTEPATEDITVRFKVQQVSDGGFVLIRPVDDGSVKAATDADGKVIPGEYDVTFTRGSVRKELRVADMDGTNDTLGGLDLNAVVTTTNEYQGVSWSNYYTRAESALLRVQNVEPSILRPTEAEAAYTNENASANVAYKIYYGASDVSNDLHSAWISDDGLSVRGVVVRITIDGTVKLSTNVTSTAVGFYEAKFEGEGAHVVEVSFTDKDGMTSRRTINFFVKPSKRLQLRAHGPAGAIGTTGGYSMHYGAAAGLGAGRVYAGKQGPQSVSGFVHSYSFGENETAVNAYAFGYKADGKADDGTLLPKPDQAIDENGDFDGASTPVDCYNYSTDHRYGLRGYDSFLYGWACNNTEASNSQTQNAGGGTTTTTPSFLLNIGASGETLIPLPSADNNNNNNNGKATSYPVQYWEAVFSREWLKTDNCGDINQDGVPDITVFNFGMGIVDGTGKLISGGGAEGEANSEGDLADLKDWNKDVDKDGADDPDYLPATETASYASLIPGLKESWVDGGVPFGAKLEIRGYGDGLNDALELLGVTDVTSDRIYEDPDLSPTSTLSKVEFLAWSEYKAAHPSATEEDWSPERPTKPTKSDTDGDGFTDGYEYFFWYKAHVGYMENGVHKYLTGRAYDPRNPGEGRFIAAAEIADLMDPLVASGDAASAKFRDTDNDGLPDLLEFEIGTNPFDFDTDGDGLPDGFEIMLGGTDPLLAETTKGVSDAMRNFDGDAMAFTTPYLEANIVLPKPLTTDALFTFALVDPKGDTDGIQWYVGKSAPTNITVAADGQRGTSFKVGDVTYVTRGTVPVVTNVTDGATGAVTNLILAADLPKATTWATLATNEAPEGVEVTAGLIALMPTRIAAGTAVAVLDAEATYATLALGEDAEGVNAAWVYGRSVSGVTTGDSLANMGGFGMLAIGRYQDAKAEDATGAKVMLAALPAQDDGVAYLHHFVYQEFGFDPRTAWNANTPLAPRWGKTVGSGETSETVANNYTADYGYAGVATRTREYTLYDEFLVLSFFLNNGKLSEADVTATQAVPWEKIWSKYTTNGQGPNEPNWEEDNEHFKGRTAETNSGTNGADTDMDGVPDGWELYVMAGPKIVDEETEELRYNLVAPYNDGFYSSFGPFVGDAANASMTDNNATGGRSSAGGDYDGLTELQEYAGTDSCAYYCEPWGGNAAAFSTTIVRPEEHAAWLNKFFPTDPWTKDTDGDGLTDGSEAGKFKYGKPVDDGKMVAIPGGGLNPCTVDTDRDGLPDGWEAQFAGKTVYAGEDAQKPKDKDGNEVADGNVLQGYCDGMDGTVWDAYNSPRINNSGENYKVIYNYNGAGVNQVVDRDYDRDGLENWQEYMTGAMRAWRYDDPLTGWSYIPDDFYWFLDPTTGEYVFSPDLAGLGELTGETVSSEAEFWYKTLFDSSSALYNPHFVTGTSPSSQYFSRVTNGWDMTFTEQGTYYMFYDRVNDAMIKDSWGFKAAPKKYISTSPIVADTDKDGMDDGYELFHGMNPILGAPSVRTTSNGPCDIVYDAWYDTATKTSPVTALDNPWVEKLPGYGTYDFTVHPWLNGIVDADPDGDDIRNQDEAIMPMVAPSTTWYHTDPTPLWMTDSSYGDSLVNRFFRMPVALGIVPVPTSIVYKGVEYPLIDRDGFTWGETMAEPPQYIAPFVPDFWKLSAAGAANWMYSFEENEGYDSDHDSGSDSEELQGKFRSKTDPQDADSPRRRQAMYFGGPENPSALQSMPFVDELYPRATMGYPDDMSFLQYTVECWVKPESAADATVLERTSFADPSHVADERYVRRNFAIMIRNGRWCTAFDSNGTLDGSIVEVVGKTDVKVGEWAHVAATFDANRLTLYVNGNEDGYVRSSLKPEYGSSAVVVFPAGSGSAKTNGTVDTSTGGLEALKGTAHAYWFDSQYTLNAFLIGASFANAADGNHLDVTQQKGWGRYRSFFKGYVDEVRVWDGARSSSDIAADVSSRKRYTREDALANRDDFYDQWVQGKLRYNKDGSGKDLDVLPELRFHWAFDSIPGAENAAAVAQAPHGFLDGPKAPWSRPEGYEIPWWAGIVGAYGSVYEGERNWVPWIPNTVTHLPRFDLTTLDSYYWSEDYAGDAAGIYKFARTAEPVSKWTQYVRNGTEAALAFQTTGRRFWLSHNTGSNATVILDRQFEFTGRHLNQTGDDLLPLGGAFAKYVDSMWDDQGASSMWEQTGNDADNDGLADWWQEYAEQNYREGVPEGEDITWNTMIWYEVGGVKVRMTAGEAYQRDLAKGVYVDAKGEVKFGYPQTEDLDKDGMPDWWERMNGLHPEEPDPSSGHADGDPDNDGLSNYAEYLASAVYGFYGLDPLSAYSALPNQKVTDYFLPITNEFPLTIGGSTFEEPRNFSGGEYLGAILTDHDFMEDWWENRYAKTYASAKVYDPWDDTDGDGWSNFCECRAALWGGLFLGDTIDRWLDSDQESKCYPQPAIGIRVTYANDQINDVAGKGLVVHTMTTSKRVDATFKMPGSSETAVEVKNHIIGAYYEKTTLRGFLNPGCLIPGDAKFYKAELSSDRVYHWKYWGIVSSYGIYSKEDWIYGEGSFEDYRTVKRMHTKCELLDADIEWELVGKAVSDPDGRYGTVKYAGTNTTSSATIATVDFQTGEFALDLRTLGGICDIQNSIFAADYSYKLGANWPQTVWLSEATTGRVKEGLNTIEAFIDLNGNGNYDVGEPYGAVKNVQVGWHKVPEIILELTDTSTVVPRTAITAANDDVKSSGEGQEAGGEGQEAGAEGGATTATKVRIVRESINGQTDFGGLKMKERTVMAKEFVMDDRAYLTEADVLSAKKPDLDWQYLKRDAVKYGITSVDYVTYRIESYYEMPDGTISNTVIGAFTHEFGTVRPSASAVAPIAGSPVYTAAPTFQFTTGKDAAAFEIQVADETGKVIYDSGVQMLGGRASVAVGSYVHTFTAPIYADASIVTNGAPVLADGKTYKWRVTAFNAKFNEAVETDYSDWTPFQMDVDNVNRYPVQPTGYGRAGAIVRYFGPAKTNDLTNLIVVEAFENADFTGQAMAQTRVADLADISDACARIDTLDCVNAMLKGLDVGTVYLRAYIDLNNNGKWDKFEPWGYANEVGKYGADYTYPPIYNPRGVEVGASAANVEKPNFATIFIEDTDWNKNKIPDCLEDIWNASVWPLPPVDPETAFELEDSDGGGAPDDWEEGAGTDPADPEDERAALVATDVMAYEDIEDVLLVRIGTSDFDAAWYAVMDLAGEGVKLRDSDIPPQTDASLIKSLFTTWNMTGFSPVVQGIEPHVGIGQPVAFEPGEAKVLKTAYTTVRLVHAQVYAKNGFNTLTANAKAYAEKTAVNTKPFTVLDKYLVCRYLENIGVDGVSESNMLAQVRAAKTLSPDAETWDIWRRFTLDPNEVDGDHDGIADGWELYVMFGPGTVAKISPFKTADGMLVAPGAGSQLKLVEEFDGGYLPTDPWAVDTDGDGVIDYYAYQYHLKGNDAGEDLDGDGLSNYAEYLISEVFRVAKLDPENPKTDGACVDYFRKMGDLYVGEIFTDHDQVGDVWEDEYLTAASRYAYNPWDDDDNDGWSNYAEFRAGTDPSTGESVGLVDSDKKEYSRAEFPIPVIEAKVVYNGTGERPENVVFKAWNEKTAPDMTCIPDAVWTRTTDATASAADHEKYLGLKPSGFQRYLLDGGSVIGSSVKIKVLNKNYIDASVADTNKLETGKFVRKVGDPDQAKWYVAAKDDGRGNITTISVTDPVTIGTVDMYTGIVTIDFSKLNGEVFGDRTTSNGFATETTASEGNAGYDQFTLEGSHVKVEWSAKETKLSADGTYYLAEADGKNATASEADKGFGGGNDAEKGESKGNGRVKEGLNTFICYADRDGSGTYTPGEPFGVVRGVDVGWQGAKFTVELTETTAITPRIALWDDANDREATVDGFLATFDLETGHRGDVDKYPGSNKVEKAAAYLAAMKGRVDTSNPPEPGEKTKIRVVRYGINSFFTYQCGIYSVGAGEGFDQRVVLEKTYDQAGRGLLSEQDFLGQGQFDIDWGMMQEDGIVDDNGISQGGVSTAAGDVTSMTYLVVIGDGKKDFRGELDTNTVRALSTVVTRRFEKTRSLPVAEDLGVVHGARPTFVWSMPNEDKWASEFGSTYTAFRIQVMNAKGKTVYDSDVQRAPAQVRKNGKIYFTWTADLYAGDFTKQKWDFLATGDFTWKVSMYNAKFRSNAWSNEATLSTAVNAQQDVNDNGYSTVNVAVKYAGPDSVLDECMNRATPKGKIHVQAFETADFSGEPIAQVYTTAYDAIIDTSKLEANAKLIGLPADGSYYIRAYIDMNGNRKLDDWESWGCAKEPVVLTGRVTAPEIGLFIEDADTDNDLVPDAYEYAAAGWTDDFEDIKRILTSAVDDAGKILFSAEGYANLTNGLAGLSTGLPGASLTLMMNQWFKDMIEGPGSVELTPDEASAMVLERTRLLDNSVRITAFSVDTEKKVAHIYFDGEAQTTTAGEALITKYNLTDLAITVNVKVFMVKTLAEAWPKDPLFTTEAKIQIGKDSVAVDADLTKDAAGNPTNIDFNSGFFKLVVEQK